MLAVFDGMVSETWKFQTPVERVSAIDMLESHERLGSSLLFAVLAVGSAGLMVILVHRHVPPDPDGLNRIADYFPVAKVMLCMAAVGGFGNLAWLIALPTLLQRRFVSLAWLIPMFLTLLVFVMCYDWGGLFTTGKAWGW